MVFLWETFKTLVATLLLFCTSIAKIIRLQMFVAREIITE